MQPNRYGSTQVYGKRLDFHRLCCCTAASVQLCFGGGGGHDALVVYFPCNIMPPLTDFLDCRSPAQSASARARRALWLPCHSNNHPTRGFPMRNLTTLFMFRSCPSGRGVLDRNFMVAKVLSFQSWDKYLSLAATARNVVVYSGPNSGSVLPSLPSDLVSSLDASPGVGSGTCTLDAQCSDHLFQVARVCFYPKPPWELHRTVLFRIWSSLFRSASSPIICVLISNFS